MVFEEEDKNLIKFQNEGEIVNIKQSLGKFHKRKNSELVDQGSAKQNTDRKSPKKTVPLLNFQDSNIDQWKFK